MKPPNDGAAEALPPCLQAQLIAVRLRPSVDESGSSLTDYCLEILGYSGLTMAADENTRVRTLGRQELFLMRWSHPPSRL